MIVKISKIENVKLVCNKVKKETVPVGHLPLGHWILTLVNLDKKVIFFNLLKKLNLISQNKKIYLFKKALLLRN